MRRAQDANGELTTCNVSGYIVDPPAETTCQQSVQFRRRSTTVLNMTKSILL